MATRRHKEFLPTQETEEEPAPIKFHPNYIRAEKYAKQFHVINKATEGGYHRVIAKIKELCSRLPTEAQRTYFEMDRKALCNSVEDMHTFISPYLYFELSCDFWDRYWVYYHVAGCPFKEEIEQIFRRYAAYTTLKAKELKVPLQRYFKVVLEVQPKEFIKTINPDDYQLDKIV